MYDFRTVRREGKREVEGGAEIPPQTGVGYEPSYLNPGKGQWGLAWLAPAREASASPRQPEKGIDLCVCVC